MSAVVGVMLVSAWAVIASCFAVEAPVADVAVTNHNLYPVTVTLTSAGGATETFEAIVASGTTPSRRLSLEQFGTIEVSCSATGCESGALELVVGLRQTIHVVEREPPSFSYSPPPPPTVVAMVPADGATGVGLNTSVAVTFSTAMDPSTVGAAADDCSSAIALSNDDFSTCLPLEALDTNPVDPAAVRFRPLEALRPDDEYVLRVTTAASSAQGRPLATNVSSRFTTGMDGDESAPAAIDDLAVDAVEATALDLVWTAVGDDDRTGRAQAYEVRYAPGDCPLNFAQGTAVADVPRPRDAGERERLTITGLTPETAYCFGVRVLDEVPNPSMVSNAVQATTLRQADSVPPARPELAVDDPTPDSLRVRWTAVGDDETRGRATRYELRFAQSGMCPAHDGAEFLRGDRVGGIRAPQPAGTAESVVAGGLAPDVLYCFVLAVIDDAGNASFSEGVSGRTEDKAGGW